MINYTLILSRKYEDAHCILNGNDYEGLVWLGNDPKPTKEELDNLWPIVQAEIEAESEAKATQRQAILDRLGLTSEEARLILG